MRIDLLSLEAARPKILIDAIRDAIESYVKENLAKEMVKALKPMLDEELKTQLVGKVSNELFAEAIKKIDLDAVVKIATVQAGKNLGKAI